MKFKWEENDIIAGRKYSRLNEIFMIGWMAIEDSDECYVTISITLNDGLVTQPVTKAALADQLTIGEYIPMELIETTKKRSYAE